jgi:hypothetical protein
MMKQNLMRKLIVRAPPDLVGAIYARCLGREGPSWPEIIRAVQDLGIFTEVEALAFLQLIADPSQNAM